MTISARITTAVASFVLFCVVVASAAAGAVASALTSPLTAVWHEVVGTPEQTGQRWSADDYVRLIATAEEQAPTHAAASAIGFAAARIGVPYAWGGTGPSGYDCSGLTQAAYKAAGVDIPRVATAQYREGEKVDLKSLDPGDLVYYGNPQFAHHVAIYLGELGGEGVVLDAPRTGEVIRLDPLLAQDLFAATRPAVTAADAVTGTTADTATR